MSESESVTQNPPGTIEGKVARVTGAGKLIVEPAQQVTDATVGDEVKIITADTYPHVSLTRVEKPMTTPIASSWAIVFHVSNPTGTYTLYADGNQLMTFDNGVSRSEVVAPDSGTYYFRIPSSMTVRDDSIIEVKESGKVVRRERFGSIPTS